METLLQSVDFAFKNTLDTATYAGWTVRRIYGGMNGIIYRAVDDQTPDAAITVKIRRRDERGRAWREYTALKALAGLNIAPQPLGYFPDMPDLPGDVVISSWIEGEVLNDMGQADRATWEMILAVFACYHALKPQDAPDIQAAVLPIRASQDVVEEVARRLSRLPDVPLGDISKQDIQTLFEAMQKRVKAIAPVDDLRLIACDTNPTNMIRQEGHIFLVDWESAGWGDAAFDVADLLVRPNCAALTEADRQWVRGRYAEIRQTPALIERIEAYERLMLIFWLTITCNGFVAQSGERLPGVKTFTYEETLNQQRYYLQRIKEALA